MSASKWSVLALMMACGSPRLPLVDAGAPSSDGDAGFTLQHHTGLESVHLASCDSVLCGEAANPPLGGPHCPSWSTCRVFDAPIPRCMWLHNLEHGHAVLAYNCPTGCADLVASLTAIWQAEHDRGNTRVLVTPDPKLPTQVAAMVWGWGWVGDTVDPAAIGAVLSHQDQDAPERGLSCSP